MADMDAERKRQQQAISDAVEDEKLRVSEERKRTEKAAQDAEKAAERTARNTPQGELGGQEENADGSRPRENDAAHEAPSEGGASSEPPAAPDNGEQERTVSLSDESIEAVKEGSKEGVKGGSSEVEEDRQRRGFETGENEKERRAMVETARQIDVEREVRQTAEPVPQARQQPPQVQGETANDVAIRYQESRDQGNGVLSSMGSAVLGAAMDTAIDKGRRTAVPAASEAAGDVIEAAGEAATVAKGVTESTGKLAGAVRSVAAFGSKLLPVVGGIATAASALGTIHNQALESGRVAMNLTGENDPVLGSVLRAQMATQRTMSATFDGLDVKDSQTIQNTLINNGVNFQSENFDDAYQYSSDMVVKYGMDAGKAAKRYAEAVQYGTMTVEDLDETMQALAKSAKDSGKSLEQLDGEYEKSVQKWEKVTGDLGDAYVMASETMKAAAEAGASANGYAGYMAKGASLIDEDNPLHAAMVSDEYDRLIGSYMQGAGITDASEISIDTLNAIRLKAQANVGARDFLFGDMKYTVDPKWAMQVDGTKIAGKTLEEWLSDDGPLAQEDYAAAVSQLANGLKQLALPPYVGNPYALDFYEIRDTMKEWGYKDDEVGTPDSMANALAGIVRANIEIDNMAGEGQEKGKEIADSATSKEGYDARNNVETAPILDLIGIEWYNDKEGVLETFDSQGLTYGGLFTEGHAVDGRTGFDYATKSSIKLNADPVLANKFIEEDAYSGAEIGDNELAAMMGALVNLGVLTQEQLEGMQYGEMVDLARNVSSAYKRYAESGGELNFYNAIIDNGEQHEGFHLKDDIARFVPEVEISDSGAADSDGYDITSGASPVPTADEINGIVGNIGSDNVDGSYVAAAYDWAKASGDEALEAYENMSVSDRSEFGRAAEQAYQYELEAYGIEKTGDFQQWLAGSVSDGYIQNQALSVAKELAQDTKDEISVNVYLEGDLDNLFHARAEYDRRQKAAEGNA